jgi:hypothetical protein
MGQMLTKLAVGIFALLVLTTSMFASSQLPIHAQAGVAEAGAADIGLAIQSLFLSAGMVFLIRPKRYAAE